MSRPRYINGQLMLDGKRVVTPNRHREMRKEVRRAHKVYAEARARALQAGAAYRRSDKTFKSFAPYEDAILDVDEPRLWYWFHRRRYEGSVPVVGSAWCDSALERVRRANGGAA